MIIASGPQEKGLAQMEQEWMGSSEWRVKEQQEGGFPYLGVT